MNVRDYIFFIITYYLAWFASVLSAAHEYVWLGFIVTLIITAIQIAWLKYFQSIKNLFSMMLIFTVVGFIADSTMSLTGFIKYHANPWPLAAPWILGLWINFGVIYYACLEKWFNRYLLMAILALFGFPLAYIAGVKLGAATFHYGDISSIVIGIAWAIALPLINFIYLHFIQGGSHAHTDS